MFWALQVLIFGNFFQNFHYSKKTVPNDFLDKKQQLFFYERLRPIAASVKEGLPVLRSTIVLVYLCLCPKFIKKQQVFAIIFAIIFITNFIHKLIITTIDYKSQAMTFFGHNYPKCLVQFGRLAEWVTQTDLESFLRRTAKWAQDLFRRP